MEKRRFESFEVFSCLKKVNPRILSPFKRQFSKKWEKHRAHTLSTRQKMNIEQLFLEPEWGLSQ